jgi:hypothetical protein
MTLKSYLLLSGGGLIATYLVTTQPVVSPLERATPPRPASSRAGAPVDIQEQAARLQTRVRQEDVEFSEPSRNPFRFAAAPRPPARPAPETVDEPPPVIEDAPAPPPLRLTGIITEGGRRTAYLATIQGVVHVEEGDAVPPDYRVGRIEEDAIELVAGDGAVRRLKLRP